MNPGSKTPQVKKDGTHKRGPKVNIAFFSNPILEHSHMKPYNLFACMSGFHVFKFYC
jgi:hypothetical protein